MCIMDNMRSQKLDALRGIAILGMILFHVNYIWVHLFSEANLLFSDAFYFLLGRFVVITIILVSGIVFFLSSEKKAFSSVLRIALRRFLFLGAIALVISWVTHHFFYDQRISFGIIHFFAVISVLSLAFIRL